MGRGPDKEPRKRRKDFEVQTEPGDNARYLMHSLRVAGLPPIDYIHDAKAVEDRIGEYLRFCVEDDMKPSLVGAGLAIGIDRQLYFELEQGGRNVSPAVIDVLKKARILLEMQMSNYMQNGKINPVAGIFLSKNWYGYKDAQEIKVEPTAPLGQALPEDELRQKYLESVAADVQALPENKARRAEAIRAEPIDEDEQNGE